MTEWKSVRVGEVAQLINGDRGKNYPAARHRTASGVPFINAGHLDGGRVRLDSMDFIPPERFQLLRSGKVEVDDVLLCIRGSIGRWALVTPDSVPGAIASSLVILRSGPAILPQFLGYHIASPEGSRSIVAGNNGAAQPNVGAQQVASLAMSLPPLDVQRRIVDVLGSIDDLIENNRRRIEVLEEMARAIYSEWFVKFRYPGHEDVPMVDSALGPIPEGWKVGTVRHASAVVVRGISPKYAEDGEWVVINQKCIRDGRVSLGPSRRQEREVSDAKRIRAGDVLINSTGVGTLGRVAMYRGSSEGVTVDSHVTIARPVQDSLNPWYAMSILDKQSEIERLGAGATGQTELRKTDVEALDLLRPAQNVIEAFAAVVSPLFGQTDVLSAGIETLSALRDLLLPKLVTGQIDVSTLDLDALIAEQVS